MIPKYFHRNLNCIVYFFCLLNLISSQELPCADVCICYIYRDSFKADCSNNELHEIPDGLSTEVQILDLSGNLFDEFPLKIEEFIYLERLDLSHNRIKNIRSTAFAKLASLEVLNLAKNNISNWLDINPNQLLIPAERLTSLDLSGNRLSNFGNLRNEEFLISDSLEILKLKHCGIQSIHGRSPIEGLNRLKTLIISHNPLRRLQKLASETLEQLDLSHCEFNYIHHDELIFLPSLTVLNLSNNYRLVISTSLGSLASASVIYLDISMCNVDKTSISGFPNLKEANLRGNMIRRLNGFDFSNNSHLEMLDLSSNVIDTIDSDAFRGLNSLKWMNLSVNVIPSIPEDAFVKTPNLETLLLSRNYLNSVGNIKSASIKKLDMSNCEIQYFFSGSLSGKHSITEINLSRNLIAIIPDDLESNTLQVLDLSYNRLSSINNNTFHRLPQLVHLNLKGNRFTSIWSQEYFDSNLNLQEIQLGDNTWRCDCHEEQMQNFFLYLTDEPPKVWNINTLLCHSPANYTGMNWQEACLYYWSPANLQQNDKILLFLMVLFVGMAGCIFIVMIIRRFIRARLKALNEERERQLEEARERLRLLRMHAQQEEAQSNAPDPRDLVSPPSYDEALLMPKLDGSYFSLADVDGTPKKQRHRRRGKRRTRSNGDIRIALEERQNSIDVISVQEIETLDRSPVGRRRAPSLETSPVLVVQIESQPFRMRTHSMNNGSVPESDL